MMRKCIGLIAVFAVFTLAPAETSWPGNGRPTYPNQGCRILRSGTNLHFVYDAYGADVKYTNSTNNGITWTTAEHVDFGDLHFGDVMGCVALDGGNKPWMIASHPTVFEPPAVGISGAVRRGAGNYINGDLGIGGAAIYSVSSAMSPSSGSDPMVYSLAAVMERDGSGNPAYSKLYFFAWDTSAAGHVPTTRCCVQVASMGWQSGYDLRGSIAVTGHSGNDTIHIAFQRKVGGVSQITYVKNTNQINPSLLRSGTTPTWSLMTEVSSARTRPATNPSITTDGDSVFVAYRGPYSDSVAAGEIWQNVRKLGYGWLPSGMLRNKSQSPTVESDYPVLSTRIGTSWHEFISGSNYDIKANLDGHIVTIKATAAESHYPQIVVVPPSQTYQIFCYTCWTEGTNAYFKLYSYVPSLMGGEGGDGGEAAGLVTLGARQALVRAFPNPVSEATEVACLVSNAGRCAIVVSDIGGRIVRSLAFSAAHAGWNTVRWDGNDNSGRRAGPGVYLCRFVQGTSVGSTTVTLTR